MLYTDVKQFVSDPSLFKRKDVHLALKINAEYVTKVTARNAVTGIPTPAFFEIDREQPVDPILHSPESSRILFTRRSPINLPAINTFVKPEWRLTMMGLTPQRRDNFTLSRLHLIEANYFPARGDYIAWNGFRYTILNANPPPEAYWQQTGVWLGLLVEAVIAPEGDAAPVPNVNAVLPAEVTQNPSP